MLLQALCIISKQWVNSNWSYSPETPSLGKNRWMFSLCDLEIWLVTLKNNGHLFYTVSSFVHRFMAISAFELELQSGNVQFGSKLACFCPVWPWNLMDESPYVNLNCSYGPETAQLGLDLCDLDLRPLTLTFCKDITSMNGNKSWKPHGDTMTGTWWKMCDGRTNARTDTPTERSVPITAAWSQLKTSIPVIDYYLKNGFKSSMCVKLWRTNHQFLFSLITR